jgi:hypothetical protein
MGRLLRSSATAPGGDAGPLATLDDILKFTGVVFQAFVTSVFGGPWHGLSCRRR